jgi:hypothetical protein
MIIWLSLLNPKYIALAIKAYPHFHLIVNILFPNNMISFLIIRFRI